MIRFILADLRRLWAGSLVVVLLVALATALGVAVSLQERALRLGSARAAAKFDLIVGAPGSATQLVLSSVFLQPAPLPLVPGETLAKLSADPRVAWAAPIGFGDFYAGNPIVGTTTTLIAETARGFAAGRTFAREGEAVTGAAVNLPLDSEIVPVHGQPGMGGHRHGDVRYRVVGRLRPTGTAWDRAILVPVQAVWHVHGLGHHDDHEAHEEHEEHEEHHGIDADAPLAERWDAEDTPGLPAILVKPKSVAAAYTLRRDYRGDRTQAVFPAEVLTALYATMGDAKRILFAIAVGAQALVAASLVLVTVIHVAQRRRQIGALRAFGAPRRAVFLIVWLELFALVATGIAAGFGIGYAVSRALAAVFAAENGVILPVGFAAEDIPFALGLTAFAALLAALPAALAYREPPAQALRG